MDEQFLFENVSRGFKELHKSRWGTKHSLTFFPKTTNEWVPNKSSWATANRVMVDNLTASIDSTSPWTWVDTFLLHASFVLRAFRTNNAFRFAVWRGAYVVGLTRADRMAVYHSADTVRSAWRWLTRISGFFRFSCRRIQFIISFGGSGEKIRFDTSRLLSRKLSS